MLLFFFLTIFYGSTNNGSIIFLNSLSIIVSIINDRKIDACVCEIIKKKKNSMIYIMANN